MAFGRVGRPPSAKTLVDRQLGRNREQTLPAGDSFVLPNYSGVSNFLQRVNLGNAPSVLFLQNATKIIDNTTDETTLLSGQGTLTLPGGFFSLGRTLRIRLMGYLEKPITGAGCTLTVTLKLNSTTIQSWSRVFSTVALVSTFWQIDGLLTCQSAGGTVISNALQTALAASVNTSAVAIDTTAIQVIDVTATWSKANSGQLIATTNASIEALL